MLYDSVAQQKEVKQQRHEVEVSQETFGSAQILMVWWSDITMQCV